MKATQEIKLKLGDVVTWTSKAGGLALTKTGAILEIVAAGESPKTNLGHHGGGAPRKHESYIVTVPQKAKTAARPIKDRLYWPLVSVLARVPGYISSEAPLADIAQRMQAAPPSLVEEPSQVA